MVTKSVFMPYSNLATSHAALHNKQKYRISTNALDNVLFFVNTLAALATYYFYPAATLVGAMLGTLIRLGGGDQPIDLSTENQKRASRIALMSSTTLSALYCASTHSNYGPYAAAFAGYQGFTNGFYPLMRKVTDHHLDICYKCTGIRK